MIPASVGQKMVDRDRLFVAAADREPGQVVGDRCLQIQFAFLMELKKGDCGE